MKSCEYFKNELLMMLEEAGFGDLIVKGGYTDSETNADDDLLVFIARK